ncbi:hypothetical protein [Mangrovicoccus algicola]|nr:hypothetical protein [Mangrovicoccus algicola]
MKTDIVAIKAPMPPVSRLRIMAASALLSLVILGLRAINRILRS